MAEPTDIELFEAWGAGDRGAGAQLFDRYFGAISGFFRHKLPSTAGLDVHDDLVQATFVSCLEARAAFRREGSFRSWLYGIAYNVLRRHWERARRDGRVDFGTVSLHDLAPGPRSLVDAGDRRDRVREAMRHLPVDVQVALELYYWESMNAGEVAQVLDVPEGTVRTRLRRGRTVLGQELEALGLDPRQLAEAQAALPDRPLEAES